MPPRQKLDTVIIATDDMRIAEAAFGWGAEVSLTSAKHRSGTDRIAEVAAKAKRLAHHQYSGRRTIDRSTLINRLAREMQRDPKIEMITAAHPFENPAERRSPHQVKVVLDRLGNALYFSAHRTARRERENTSFRHQGIYGYTRDLLLRFVRWKPYAAGTQRNRSSNCARWRMA